MMISLSATYACFATVFALIAGGLLGSFVYTCVYDSGRAGSMLAPSLQSRLIFQLQRGIPALDGFSKKLINLIPLFSDVSSRVQSYLLEKGFEFTKDTLVSLLLGASALAGLLCGVLSASPVFGISAAAIVLVGSLLYVKNQSDKQDALTREEVPDAIRCLEMSFKSGHSLKQTLENASAECSGYLSKLFSASVDRLETGATTSDALSVMCDNPRVPELSFVAVALDIQHQSGGSIVSVLESAMETVEGELKLMRNLKVQTAQAKLSATIVTIMPFVLIALFSMMSPDFLSPFFDSPLGVALLIVALAMQVGGVLAVRRMLRIDGE